MPSECETGEGEEEGMVKEEGEKQKKKRLRKWGSVRISRYQCFKDEGEEEKRRSEGGRMKNEEWERRRGKKIRNVKQYIPRVVRWLQTISYAPWEEVSCLRYFSFCYIEFDWIVRNDNCLCIDNRFCYIDWIGTDGIIFFLIEQMWWFDSMR